MPHVVARDAACERIDAEVPDGACPMCFVTRASPPLAERESAVLVFNAYPLRWGHLLVVLRDHVVTFDQLAPIAHREASSLVHAAARAIERALRPPRVFVACLGAPDEGLKVTSPHLHWHLVPLMHPDERPSEVFTWQHGVLGGTPEEWDDLRARLRRELEQISPALGA